MDIIFVGGFFLEQNINDILLKSKRQIQNSANNFQWNLIHGIESNLERSIKLVTAPFVGWYPRYFTSLIVKSSYQTRGDDSTLCIGVGFLNIPLIKNIYKYFNLKKHIKKSLSTSGDTVIIVYSLESAYLKAALDAKANNPNISVCVIVTDLHEFPGDAGFLYLLYIKYIEKPIFYKLLHQIDCFVVLTDKMVDYLRIQEKPWIRIEGLYTPGDFNNQIDCKSYNGIKIILFTGTLDYRYGIKDLLDAFHLIKDEHYRLWICGGGPCVNLVKDRANSDARIKYFGLVPKHTVADLQRKATILVNPRNNDGAYNKYSFPSKTMEYFASGTPTLMYKLDGIPTEYFNYCYTINDNGIENFSAVLYQTCELDESTLKLKGAVARDFILNTKNSKIQCQKILTMLTTFFLNRE